VFLLLPVRVDVPVGLEVAIETGNDLVDQGDGLPPVRLLVHEGPDEPELAVLHRAHVHDRFVAEDANHDDVGSLAGDRDRRESVVDLLSSINSQRSSTSSSREYETGRALPVTGGQEILG
jgi:hypothetical protein